MKALKLVILLAAVSCKTVEEPKSEQTSAPKAEQSTKTVCRGTKMVGWESSESMTPMDRTSYQTAKRRCPEKYPRSPCLVTFERVSENNYRATCGAAREDSST